jgi:hypothetical protein
MKVDLRWVDDYTRGYLDALYDFAWYKDGDQFVGCGINSYQLAKENFLKRRAEQLMAAEDMVGAERCLAMIEPRE